MYKLKRLRKKFIFELSVMSVILAALLSLYVFASMKSDNLSQESQKLQGDLAAMNLQRQNLEVQLRRAKKSIAIYNEVKKQLDNNQFVLNRDKAQMIINQLKDKYLLPNITMRVSGITDLNTTKYKSDTLKLIQSQVVLNFSGISDEYVLSFVNELMRRLNGYIRVTNLTLRRSGEVNADALLQISQGKYPALVTGDLTFNWVGVQPIKTAPPPTEPPAVEGAQP